MKSIRTFIVTAIVLCGLHGVYARGTDEGESVPITWLNYSDYIVVDAEDCRVANRLEDELNIELILQGGTRGSSAVREQLYLAMLRGETLPDVFPWHHTLISSYPPIQELYAPLDIEMIRDHMPNMYKMLEDASIRQFGSIDNIWKDVTVDGAIYAIPRLTLDYSYRSGVLWRKDILDELNLQVPETVEEWELVFEAYKKRYPDKLCWGGIDGRGYVFEPIFYATGEYTSAFIRVGDDIEPWITQPLVREVIETLRRWYDRGYIEVFSQNVGGSPVPDTNRYFTKGDMIVTDNAWVRNGDLICDEPYYPHSLPDRTHNEIPNATFAVGPHPRFESVEPFVLGSDAGEPKATGFFGFNADLSDEPDRLTRIMKVIDTILGDEKAFLLTQYGEEGKDWDWQTIGGDRQPVRHNLDDRSSNIGKYWLMSYSPFQRTYGTDPRIQESIYDRFLRQGAVYGGGPDKMRLVSDSRDVLYRIPYSDVREETSALKATYQQHRQSLHELFYRRYYIPIIKGALPLEALDEFVDRYYEEGGNELIDIIKQWSYEP